ncbi:hypothetical protein RUM44_006873 [Polyplax serrata]|uniref:Uncharacterized protein n=1 Tax=Polyplax serrata TaxID=468196 RepID=A0ABR1AKU3_POLSC
MKGSLNVFEILRHSSTKSKSVKKPTTNGVTKPFVVNRNPRNLELLRLEKKPTGYGVDNKDVEFWNRLELFTTPFHVTARLVHNTQNIVVEASTKEWAIRQFLYSGRDKQAYVILARVFAERCLESGYQFFKCEKPDDKNTNVGSLDITLVSNPYSLFLAAFLETLEEEGIVLEEYPYFNIHDIWRRKREKKPWTVL